MRALTVPFTYNLTGIGEAHSILQRCVLWETAACFQVSEGMANADKVQSIEVRPCRHILLNTLTEILHVSHNQTKMTASSFVNMLTQSCV